MPEPEPQRPPPSRVPDELDRVTLERARRGDHDALHALVVRYERPVFALLSRMTGGHDPALVEDLAQDTFLKAFGAIAGFDPRGPAKLSTWLLTIASRTAIDALRKRRVALVELDDAGPLVAGAPAFDALDDRRRDDRVARAVLALPDAQRVALVLFTWHGFSIADVATALGVEEGTVKSRLARARQALASSLAEVPDVA